MDKGVYVATTYETLRTSSTFKVYNSANEEIEGVSVDISGVEFTAGIIIPYGGYLELTVNSGYRLNVYYNNILLWNLAEGVTYKIKIVDNLTITSTKLSEQTDAPT